jgi:DNA polymerase III alpha subunit (gram-positive type)
MRSPYNRIVVYDLETGGLNKNRNSLTEIAMVAIDLETLKVVEEGSVLIKPKLLLANREKDAKKEAQVMFKTLATTDEDRVKTLLYKDQHLTLKTLDILIADIKEFETAYFKKYMTDIITYDVLKVLEDSKFKDVVGMYFDMSYNPKALSVTKITRDMLVNEGVEFEDAYKFVTDFFIRHTIGNSKPILAGHNIAKFDNPFTEIFFNQNFNEVKMVNGDTRKKPGNLADYINNTIQIDTIQWARIKWFEAPSFALGACANEVGLTLKGAHRALADTLMNAQFLIKMLKNLRGEGTQESTYKREKFDFSKI